MDKMNGAHETGYASKIHNPSARGGDESAQDRRRAHEGLEREWENESKNKRKNENVRKKVRVWGESKGERGKREKRE